MSDRDAMAEVFNKDQSEAVARDTLSWDLSVADSEANTRMKNAIAERTEAVADLLRTLGAAVTVLLIGAVIFGLAYVISLFV